MNDLRLEMVAWLDGSYERGRLVEMHQHLFGNKGGNKTKPQLAATMIEHAASELVAGGPSPLPSIRSVKCLYENYFGDEAPSKAVMVEKLWFELSRDGHYPQMQAFLNQYHRDRLCQMYEQLFGTMGGSRSKEELAEEIVKAGPLVVAVPQCKQPWNLLRGLHW